MMLQSNNEGILVFKRIDDAVKESEYSWASLSKFLKHPNLLNDVKKLTTVMPKYMEIISAILGYNIGWFYKIPGVNKFADKKRNVLLPYNISTKVCTVEQLVNDVEDGLISLNSQVQRARVWTAGQKREFIKQILAKGKIPPITISVIDGKKDSIIDGKQRTTALQQFINNEFRLSKEYDMVLNDNCELCDISGKLFKELDKSLQRAIKRYNLQLDYYENLDDNREGNVFKGINNGTKLNSVDKIVAIARSRYEINSLCEHILFTHLKPPKKDEDMGKDTEKNRSYVLHSIRIINGYKSFRQKEMESYYKDHEVNMIEYNKVYSIFSKIDDIYSLLDKGFATELAKDQVFTAVVNLINKYEHYNSSLFAAWIPSFFGNFENENYIEYSEHTKDASSSEPRIRKRLEISEKDFLEFVSINSTVTITIF